LKGQKTLVYWYKSGLFKSRHFKKYLWLLH